MDYKNNNTASRKNKHLNFKECMTIEIRLKNGFSIYKITKELVLLINTITNEIKRDITKQIRQENHIKICHKKLTKLYTQRIVLTLISILRC